jgi:L-ascorbate metabolism protein UlaG (beta-lactamase superfamily)
MERGFRIEAVPAYNIVHKREDGEPYHAKGHGNGYVLAFGDKRVYIAGDTENTPEMKALTGIDAAFLPLCLPSTMTPAMAADATLALKPRILYLYHCEAKLLPELTALLENVRDIEIRALRTD